MSRKDARSVAEARKRVNRLLLETDHVGDPNRRVAFAGGVIAISGKDGWDYAMRVHKVDLRRPGLRASFDAMFARHDAAAAIRRDPHLCAEANLWMTLRDLYLRTYNLAQQPERVVRTDRPGGGREVRPLDLAGAPRHHRQAPRHLALSVFQQTRKSISEDSPCANCRQWVRAEFLKVNGT